MVAFLIRRLKVLCVVMQYCIRSFRCDFWSIVLEFEVVFVGMQEKIRRKAAGLKNPLNQA